MQSFGKNYREKLDGARHLLASTSAFATDDVSEADGGLVQTGVFRTIAPVYLRFYLDRTAA